jgi:cell division protein FtsX
MLRSRHAGYDQRCLLISPKIALTFLLETAMRAFVFAIIAAVVLALGFWVVLSSAQRTADEAFKTEGVRN